MKIQNNKIVLLGIPVNNVDLDEALERIIEMTELYKRDSKNRLVATANVDFIINANKGTDKQKARQLLSTLRKADMVTADGMPLVWLSKLLGRPLKKRVTGADMVPALAKIAAARGKSIYLLGGKDGSAKRTAEILKAENPGLKIAGINAPMINLDDIQENKNIIARINIAHPDILLIALGNPKQELWFQRYREYLRIPVSIGVGGTFEFISGITSRAPHWIQKSGFEWTYRIKQDPKRLIKRYAAGLFSFNLMTLPLLALHYLFSIYKSKSIERGENVLPFFQKIYMDISVNWEDISNTIGVRLLLDQLTTVSRLTLNFKGITRLNMADSLRLMEVLLAAQHLNVVVETQNLGILPSLMLRANRIYDLVQSAAQIAPLTFGDNQNREIA